MFEEIKSRLSDVTDIGARCDKLEASLIFRKERAGPAILDRELLGYVGQMVERFKAINLVDATMEIDKIFWRGHLDAGVVDGQWVRFRKMPEVVPTLNTLPSPLPPQVRAALLDQELSRGGLILVTGAAGCGKTTTASGTVASRLLEFGGMASTIEDPPEQPLNGWHGEGYCAQTWVQGGGKDPWAEAMRGVLRSQPAGTPTIMFLGEVREDEAARVAVQAAGNGFLVIATSFGSDVPTGIGTFARRIGKESLDTFASQLKIVLHQNLISDTLQVKMLRSNSAVEQCIIQEKFTAIEGEVQIQANQMRLAAAAASRAAMPA